MGPPTVPRATCPGTWVAGRLVAGHRPGERSEPVWACANTGFRTKPLATFLRAEVVVRAAANDTNGPNAAGRYDAVERECL